MTEVFHMNGTTIATDEEGFLLNPADWSPELAHRIAAGESLHYADDVAWVVDYVRRYFDQNQVVPEARTLLKAMGAELAEDKGTRKYLYQLFPYGYGQQACKIAGMCKPRKLMLDI